MSAGQDYTVTWPRWGRRKIEVGSLHQINRFALLIYFASILVRFFFYAFVPLMDSEFVHCGVKEGNRVDIKNLISVQQGHLASVKPKQIRSEQEFQKSTSPANVFHSYEVSSRNQELILV